MNKFVKKLMALGLSVGMLAGMGLGFAGCDNGKTDVPDTPIVDPNEDPNVNPGKDPDINKDPDKEPDTPVKPPVTEKKTLQQAVTEFDAFVQKCVAGKNFTYTMEKPLQKITAEFAGDKVKLNNNDVVTFLTKENGENFLYRLEDDNAWHKDFADENISIDYALSTVTNALDDINWTGYDSDLNLLSGSVTATVDGLPVSAKFEANFDQNDLSVKMKNGLSTTNVAINKVGTTTVTLPANVKDETAESNNIFTVENGETVWNVKAIKDVLEPWLKNEDEGNQYGKDVFAVVRVNDNYKTKEVLYINPSKERISFGVIHEENGQLSFGETYFNDPSLYEILSNKTSMTRKEFRDYLMQLDARRVRTSITDFDVEYTTHDEDYETTHKLEFETLTKNGFEKLASVGVQGDSILNEGEIVKEYEGAKILFGFKTPMDDVGLSKDMGNVRSFSIYSLIKNGENTELIHLRLVGKNTWAGWEPSALESVLQNKDNAWRIFKLEKHEIAKENVEILGEPIMTIGKETNLSKE